MANKDSADPATEIKEILATGKKKSLNFALMKSKDGVVLKAHATKAAGVMVRECKAAGGMPAMQAQGVLNVKGKLIEMTLEDPDVSDTLAKHAKKYFSSLGISCKIAFLLPGGVRLGEEDDEKDGAESETKEMGDGSVTPSDERAQGGEPKAEPESAAPQSGDAPGQPATAPADELRESLMKEFAALAPRIAAAKASGLAPPLIKKLEAVESMFHSTIDQNPKKASGVITLLSKTLENVPETSAPEAKPADNGKRAADLADLNKSVDALLAEFA